MPGYNLFDSLGLITHHDLLSILLLDILIDPKFFFSTKSSLMCIPVFICKFSLGHTGEE